VCGRHFKSFLRPFRIVVIAVVVVVDVVIVVDIVIVVVTLIAVVVMGDMDHLREVKPLREDLM